MKHTISVLVENEFGVLARVAGLFAAKGYNIDSLSVSETLDPTVSRMTIETHGDDKIVEQIIKQLNRLINVLKVQDLTGQSHIERELILIKVTKNSKSEGTIDKITKGYGGKVLDATRESCILEFAGDAAHIAAVFEALKPLGLVELVRTGKIGILRGPEALK